MREKEERKSLSFKRSTAPFPTTPLEEKTRRLGVSTLVVIDEDRKHHLARDEERVLAYSRLRRKKKRHQPTDARDPRDNEEGRKESQQERKTRRRKTPSGEKREKEGDPLQIQRAEATASHLHKFLYVCLYLSIKSLNTR